MPKNYVKTEQNERRIRQGFAAIREGGGLDDRTNPDDADVVDALGDTLANLLHFAETQGLDFDNALRRARGHFAVERTGEED